MNKLQKIRVIFGNQLSQMILPYYGENIKSVGNLCCGNNAGEMELFKFKCPSRDIKADLGHFWGKLAAQSKTSEV